MKRSSHKRLGLLVLSTFAAVWAAGCSDDDDKLPSEWFAGGTENGGGKATGGHGTVGGAANGGTTGIGTVTGGTTSSSAPSAGNSSVAGVGNTAGTVGVGGNGVGGNGVGGSSSSNGGAGGATTATAAGGVAGGVACGTTPSSFAYSETVFPAGSTLQASGFSKLGGATNSNPVVQIVTTPSICSAGCLQIGGTFAAGDAKNTKTVAVTKPLSGDAGNLLGAKMVVKLAVENPSNVPIWFTLFATGTNGAWGDKGLGNTQLAPYAVANGLSELVWDVADMYVSWQTRQFCAASVNGVGIMLQTGNDVPPSIPSATVSVYVQSIELRPAGYVPSGTGGSSGVAGAAGAAGVAVTSNAGSGS